jgi:chromosome segregation ATPase
MNLTLFKELLKFVGYVGLVLLIINIFNINPNFRHSHENQVLNAKIDSLNNIVIQNSIKIELYDSKIDALSDSITIVDNQLDQNKIKISKIKQEYEKKLNNINTASADELTQFFSERYK